MIERVPVPEGLLDLIGFDTNKLTALAEGVALTMLTQLEPVIVKWATDWANQNVGPAIQSLLDAIEEKLTQPQ